MKNPTDEKAALMDALKGFVTALCKVIVIATLTLSAFAAVLMLLVNIWHGVRPDVPAIGFHEAFVVVALVRFVTSFASDAKK